MVTWMQSRMRKKRASWVTECPDGSCGPVVVTVLYFFCILHDGYMGRTFTMESLDDSSLALRRIHGWTVLNFERDGSFYFDHDDHR
jgi:hypothetical protein